MEDDKKVNIYYVYLNPRNEIHLEIKNDKHTFLHDEHTYKGIHSFLNIINTESGLISIIRTISCDHNLNGKYYHKTELQKSNLDELSRKNYEQVIRKIDKYQTDKKLIDMHEKSRRLSSKKAKHDPEYTKNILKKSKDRTEHERFWYEKIKMTK